MPIASRMFLPARWTTSLTALRSVKNHSIAPPILAHSGFWTSYSGDADDWIGCIGVGWIGFLVGVLDSYKGVSIWLFSLVKQGLSASNLTTIVNDFCDFQCALTLVSANYTCVSQSQTMDGVGRDPATKGKGRCKVTKDLRSTCQDF